MTYSEQKIININRNLAMALTPTHLELIILPTEQCNFRCSYCYEDFKIGKMTDSTVFAIKSLIAQRMKDLHTFRLSWFGGEPLLAKDIILDISAHAKAECEKHNVSFLQGDITTNGYRLSLTVLKELAALSQSSFQISLDGFGEVHNTTRKLLSERGTFERIWSNLIDLHQSDEDFSVLLRLHLTPENLSSIELLIEEIIKVLLPDPRLSIVFKPVSNFRGPSCSDVKTLDNDYAESVIARLQKQLDGQVLDLKNDDSFYICYASKPNTLLIRANGNIGKCTVALNDSRNNIGHINDDGTLTINNAAMLPWLRGFKTRDPKSLACPMQDMPEQSMKVYPETA